MSLIEEIEKLESMFKDDGLSSSQKIEIEDKIEIIKAEQRFEKFILSCGVGRGFLSASFENIKKAKELNIVGDSKALLHTFEFKDDNYILSSSTAFDIYQVLKTFVDEIYKHFEKGTSIIFTGQVGSGKTYTAIALAIEILKTARIKKTNSEFYTREVIPSFVFIQAQDLIYLETSRSFENEKKFDAIQNCDILILDDLGSEKHNEMFGTVEQLVHRVIKHRDHNNFITFITANCSPDGLSKNYGQRANSVLYGNKYKHITLVSEKSWRLI